MSATLPRVAACLGLTIGIAVTAGAQSDVKSDVRKQRERAEQLLKQAGVKKSAAVETAGLVVYGTVPDAQAKALADTLQKVYQTSRSSLKFGGDESLWPGKLTVVVLSDPRQFAEYYQRVNGKPPAAGQTSAFDLSGNSPYLILGPGEGANPAAFDPTRAAANLMAAAVLNRRAGAGTATLPDWLTSGFAEGVLVRADDDPNALAAHRSAMRSSVLGDPRKPFPAVTLESAMSGPRTPANNVMSASFVEYLLARTTPAQFDRFLAAFRPVEGRPPPTLNAALRTLPLSRVSMETDWKVWAAQQK